MIDRASDCTDHPTMKTLIVDDHELFSEGLKLLVCGIRPDINVAIANSCQAAVDLKSKGDFELVLLDHHLPDAVGLVALQQVRESFPRASIVVISSEENSKIIRDAIAHGASGFITKSSSKEVLISALSLVLSGGCYLPPQILETSKTPKPQPALHDLLTRRQQQVIELAIKGTPNKIIANQLRIAEGTVKAHLSSAFRILGVNNRTEAVIAVAKLGSKNPGL